MSMDIVKVYKRENVNCKRMESDLHSINSDIPKIKNKMIPFTKNNIVVFIATLAFFSLIKVLQNTK